MAEKEKKGLIRNVEKRFINGKEIIIKPKQPITIQQKINKKNVYTNDLAELSSTYDPDQLYKDYIGDMGNAFGRDVFYNTGNFQEIDYDRQRKQLYGIYRDMWNQIFIQNALGIVKNESTQLNEEGNRIKTISENQDITDISYELFFDILDMNYEVKNIAQEMFQMGDGFYEIILDNYEKPKTIIHLEWLNQARVNKITENGRLKFYIYTLDDTDQDQMDFNFNGFMTTDKDARKQIKILMPWQVVHFRVRDQASDPYGRSLFKSGVKDYRRLSLLEDSMLVYRLSRSIERRVFYVDVGTMNSRETLVYLNKIKNMFKKEPIITETGEISEKANVMSSLEDYYVPRREGQQGTQIQSLQAGIALNEIKDIEYFKDKLLRLINVPLSYIGGTSESGGSDQSRTLSSQDIKFASFIEDNQQHLEKGLNKILSLQLILKGFKNEEIRNFKVQLTPPSSLVQIIQLEYREKQIGLAGAYKQSGLFSDEWVYKNILRMSSKDILQEQTRITSQMQKQMQIQQLLQTQAGVGGMPGGEMGGIPPVGGEMGGAPPAGGMPPIGGEMGGAPPAGGASVPGVQPPAGGPQLASVDFNGMIYKLGMQSLLENSENLIVDNIYNTLGKAFCVENQKDLLEVLTEVKKIKNKLKDSEDEEKASKKKVNDFMSQVLTGEFEGIGINGAEERGFEFFTDGEKGNKKTFSIRKKV